MKNRAVFTFMMYLLLLVTLPVSQAYTSGLQAEPIWNYQRNLLGNESGYVYFELDEEVYQYANDDLSDIRIVDEVGTNVPYFIDTAEKAVETKILDSYLGKLINQYKENNNSFFDFEIVRMQQEFENIEDVMVNKIALNTNNINFAKTINIYGSYDNKKWEFIKEENIYRIKDSENIEVNTDVNKFTHYRIGILNNIEDLVIDSILATNVENESTEVKYKSITYLNHEMQEDTVNKVTEININNKSKLKINNINIGSEDKFYREYELYDKYNNLISTGIVTNDKSNIHLTNYINSEYLILRIYNNDDEPVKVKKISAEYLFDNIVFEKKDNVKYSLQYGNSSAIKPKYDLIHKINKVTDKKKIYMDELQKINEYSNIEIKTFNYTYILNSIIVIISITLILILVKTFNNKERISK